MSGELHDIPLDQFSEGITADSWNLYTRNAGERTLEYKSSLLKILQENGCHSVLDAACGTGHDSVMLVDEGYQVVSVDISDRMLKWALKTRWCNRKKENYDRWIIEEANWVTLDHDLLQAGLSPVNNQFDAIICIGNSFPHLVDKALHRQAIEQFKRLLRPGGILVIDHRNYDAVLGTGKFPWAKNIYYSDVNMKNVDSLVTFKNNEPLYVTVLLTLESNKKAYETQNGVKDDMCAMTNNKTSACGKKADKNRGEQKYDALNYQQNGHQQNSTELGEKKFTVFVYPHKLADFSKLLKSVFGTAAEHYTLGDYQALSPEHVPCYYIHVIKN